MLFLFSAIYQYFPKHAIQKRETTHAELHYKYTTCFAIANENKKEELSIKREKANKLEEEW